MRNVRSYAVNGTRCIGNGSEGAAGACVSACSFVVCAVVCTIVGRAIVGGGVGRAYPGATSGS